MILENPLIFSFLGLVCSDFIFLFVLSTWLLFSGFLFTALRKKVREVYVSIFLNEGLA